MAYRFRVDSIFDLKYKVNISIVIFIAFALLSSIFISHTAFKDYDKTSEKLAINELQSRLVALISNFEYRMISIASQPEFIHLINSDIDRVITDEDDVDQSLYPLMRQISSFIANKNGNSIFEGSELYNQANRPILKQGALTSKYYVIAALCYRDSSLSYSSNSPCISKWKLYISRKKLLKALRKSKFIIKSNGSEQNNAKNLTDLFMFEQVKLEKYRLPNNIYLHWERGSESFKTYTIASACLLFLVMLLMAGFIIRIFSSYILKPIERLNDHLSKEDSVDSNEFSNLPREINNFIDAINQKVKLKRIEALESLLHDIKQPLRRLQKLANNLDGEVRQNIMNVYTQIYLSVTKINHDRQEIVDINKVISDCCNTIYPDLIADNQIVLNLQPRLFCLASYSHLLRVISNIIDNAIRASNCEKTLKIKINSQASLHNCITITDNGPGIKSSEINQIFDDGISFTGSTGKGLAYSKHTIEKYQGSLTCKSSNFSTDFVIKLPRANTPGNYINSIFYNSKTKLVIIDDEVSFYQDICSLNLAISVHHLQTLKEVNDFFKYNETNNTVFLVDYHFSDEANGIDVIKKHHLFSHAYLASTAGSLLKEMNTDLSTTLPILSKGDLPNLNFINIETAQKIIVDDDNELIEDIKKINPMSFDNVIFLDNLLQLRMAIPFLDKNSHVILDNRFVGEPESGIAFSKRLSQKGFKNISLHTCDEINVCDYPFIKSIFRKGDPLYA